MVMIFGGGTNIGLYLSMHNLFSFALGRKIFLELYKISYK